MPRFVNSLALAGLALAACAGAAPVGRTPDLTTEAERSRWIRTGRHEEAVRLCRGFEVAFPGRARCQRFGTSPEGRAMVALVVGDVGAGRPVVLIEAGIHAGEIEGKDAGFWLLRDLLRGRVAPGALDAVTIVFVPIFNVDGHERFDANNRPNQRGPAEMGFRTTSQNLNLNRDFMKVDAPEMAAMLGLFRRFDPVVFVDLHTTDGAKFEHDVSVQVAPRAPRADRLGELAAALSTSLQARLTRLGHLPLSFYPLFVTDDDPTSGFEDGEAPPRFSQSYASARGRIGILVETHSWHTYGQRARATYHVLQALLERATADASAWRDAATAADADSLAGEPVALTFKATPTARTIDFRGYRYRRRPSEVSGATWISYDETAPEIWRVPLRDQLVADLTVTAPRAGYLVAAGFAAIVAPRLGAHAIAYRRLDHPVTATVEAFYPTGVEHAPPFEGRTRATIAGQWRSERRTIEAGALWIPIRQPRARLAMHLLEPAAPDSLAAWGFFNAALEQKEYMESYVAEEVAREMLKDPAIRSAFEQSLADPTFAASPERRLDFFYRRHPSWQSQRRELPVLRADIAPPGQRSMP